MFILYCYIYCSEGVVFKLTVFFFFFFLFLFFVANSDIFFDSTLSRLGGVDGRSAPHLQRSNTVLALLKWVFNSERETMSMTIRTDSQGKGLGLFSYAHEYKVFHSMHIIII